MGEVKTKIQMFEVDMICDVCSDGHMRSDGTVIPTNPPLYPHRCDNCGSTAEFPYVYPRIMYKYKGLDKEWKKQS